MIKIGFKIQEFSTIFYTLYPTLVSNVENGAMLHALQWEIPIMADFFFNLRTTKAIAIKLSIISFGTNPRIAAKFQTDPRIAAKFQTDRFRHSGGNRAEKIIEITAIKPYTVAAFTLSYADAGGINKFISVELFH